jgi:hypothetical protein
MFSAVESGPNRDKATYDEHDEGEGKYPYEPLER